MFRSCTDHRHGSSPSILSKGYLQRNFRAHFLWGSHTFDHQTCTPGRLLLLTHHHTLYETYCHGTAFALLEQRSARLTADLQVACTGLELVVFTHGNEKMAIKLQLPSSSCTAFLDRRRAKEGGTWSWCNEDSQP